MNEWLKGQLWWPVLTAFPVKHSESMSNTFESKELIGQSDSVNSKMVFISHCLPPPHHTHSWSIAYAVELPYRSTVNSHVFWPQSRLRTEHRLSWAPSLFRLQKTKTIVTAFSLLIKFLHIHLISSCKQTSFEWLLSKTRVRGRHQGKVNVSLIFKAYILPLNGRHFEA